MAAEIEDRAWLLLDAVFVQHQHLVEHLEVAARADPPVEVPPAVAQADPVRAMRAGPGQAVPQRHPQPESEQTQPRSPVRGQSRDDEDEAQPESCRAHGCIHHPPSGPVHPAILSEAWRDHCHFPRTRPPRAVDVVIPAGSPFVVIICTRNRGHQLADTLDALKRQVAPGFPIVVVDQSDVVVQTSAGGPRTIRRSRSSMTRGAGCRAGATSAGARPPKTGSSSSTTTACPNHSSRKRWRARSPSITRPIWSAGTWERASSGPSARTTSPSAPSRCTPRAPCRGDGRIRRGSDSACASPSAARWLIGSADGTSGSGRACPTFPPPTTWISTSGCSAAGGSRG